MSKYDFSKETNKQLKVEEIQPEVIINTEILIQSRIESHLSYFGRVSGKQYDWRKAGDAVLVLEEDVPELLAKRLGKKSCCGNDSNVIFQIVS